MRIGELARAAGVKAETIRYYEREGVLASPPRTQANYRDYGPEHARRLNFIRRARDLGFSMTRIRELLELADDRSRACHAVDTLARAHLGEVNRKIADLEASEGNCAGCWKTASKERSAPVWSLKRSPRGLKRERDMDLSPCRARRDCGVLCVLGLVQNGQERLVAPSRSIGARVVRLSPCSH